MVLGQRLLYLIAIESPHAAVLYSSSAKHELKDASFFVKNAAESFI